MADKRTSINPAVEREFIPDQGSMKNKTPGPREQAKSDRDELEFAENVDNPSEDLARQRESQQGSGISNRALADETAEQRELPERNSRRAQKTTEPDPNLPVRGAKRSGR